MRKHIKKSMKKIFVFTSLMLGFSLMASAQQPAIDPKRVNAPGQKTFQPGQLKLLPAAEKVSFSAVISERRSASTAIARFNQLQWNEGNGFNAETGVFTAPAQGIYCFSGNFTLGKYGCMVNPVTYGINVMKNDLQGAGSFNLPVSWGDAEGNTTESFTLLVQLNLNDRITLRSVSMACDGGQSPIVHRIVFSGYKIY